MLLLPLRLAEFTFWQKHHTVFDLQVEHLTVLGLTQNVIFQFYFFHKVVLNHVFLFIAHCLESVLQLVRIHY